MAAPFVKIPATDEEVEAEVERITSDARAVQVQTLRRILERSAHAEYLQRHGLGGRCDEASFKACLPVVTYDDIKADVDRIADGDKSAVLCADPISCFAMSSGTSGGKSKLIPYTDNMLLQKLKGTGVGEVFCKRAFPSKHDGQPVVMAFKYAGRQFETKSGLKAGTGSTNYFRSEMFKSKAFIHPVEEVSPDAVVLGYDIAQQMYCHLLCGIYRSRDVEQIAALFAYMVVELFRLLERVWQDICTDIREGTVNPRVTDTKIRAAVQDVIAPNPDLADTIERECAKGWAGIIERLFPKALFIKAIFTGGMLPYIAPLRLYAGRVPLTNGNYSASEAWMGVNLHPHCPPERTSFTILPDLAYFEFIPVHRESMGSGFVDEPEIVGLTDVKVGREYEIVLTTVSGLYRYRQADILKVTGFYNSTPEVEFVCRRGVVLSVNTDKTDEAELQMVVGKTSQILKKADLELIEFSSYTDLDSRPGHYVIFWELRGDCKRLDESILAECCKTLDTSFNNPYMRGRAAHTIGPLELVVVAEGTFGRLMDRFVRENGLGANQYKMPRCIINPASLKFLKDNTVATFQSPEFPPELLVAWRPL